MIPKLKPILMTIAPCMMSMEMFLIIVVWKTAVYRSKVKSKRTAIVKRES